MKKEEIRRVARQDYLALEKAVMAYYNGILPFYGMIDDIEKSMHYGEVDYFKLPASKAKDNLDHYFYFKINSDDEWEFIAFDDRKKDHSH